jgi:hypothetical protein
VPGLSFGQQRRTFDLPQNARIGSAPRQAFCFLQESFALDQKWAVSVRMTDLTPNFCLKKTTACHGAVILRAVYAAQ